MCTVYFLFHIFLSKIKMIQIFLVQIFWYRFSIFFTKCQNNTNQISGSNVSVSLDLDLDFGNYVIYKSVNDMVWINDGAAVLTYLSRIFFAIEHSSKTHLQAVIQRSSLSD